MKFKYLLLICPSICFAVSGTPIQQISSDLGVTPQQFEQCMKSSRPATGGEADKAVVVQCLQKINPSITQDQVRSTIMKYRTDAENNSNRAIQQISSDLKVTPQQFEECMKSGRPATGGEADKAIVVQCLQKINPSITMDQLKSTIMKYRTKPSGNTGQN